MKAVVQRVREAAGTVNGHEVGRIGVGLMVLVCAEVGDTEAQVERLLDKLLKLRIFSDDQGRLNRSLQDIDGQGAVGGLLLVSQFTLAGDVWSGNRPSFTGAAPAEAGRALYEALLVRARARHPKVAQGSFGADMQVSLVNDGPVTLIIQTP